MVCTAETLIEMMLGFGAPSGFYGSSLAVYPLFFINALLSAAIYEELLFRSLIAGYMIRWLGRPQLANIVQTALFAIVHLRYFDGQHWANVISVCVGGLLYGWITLGFRSLLPSTIGHAMINYYGTLFSPLAQNWTRSFRAWGFKP